MICNICTFFHSHTVQLSLQVNYVCHWFGQYKISNLFHKLVGDVSPMLLNNTSSARHKQIVLSALASRSSHSSSVMVRGFFLFPSKALCNPCWTNKSHIFNFQSSKLFLPLNFYHYKDWSKLSTPPFASIERPAMHDVTAHASQVVWSVQMVG